MRGRRWRKNLITEEREAKQEEKKNQNMDKYRIVLGVSYHGGGIFVFLFIGDARRNMSGE